MRAHENEMLSRNWETKFDWRGTRQADDSYVPDLFQTCTYCGSLTIDDAINAFETKGVQWSGSDWKYGWPAKFYIDVPCEPFDRIWSSEYKVGEPPVHHHGTSTSRHHKFYATHLVDATPEQLERWNRVVAPIVGVSYEIRDEKLYFKAVRAGHQAHGEIK